MKAMIALGALLISLPLFAHDDGILKESPSTLAAVQALKVYAFDFEDDTGNSLDKEIIGVHAVLDSSDVEASIYSATSSVESLKNSYHCHFHYDVQNVIEEAHCHREEKNLPFTYTQVTRNYVVPEFEQAAIHALELFKKKADPKLIVETKIWQNAHNIEFSFKWDDNSNLKIRYVMCHYHGAHMDCHNQSRPGANEPVEQVAP